MAGFWGVPTSSVDWCEANYAHSFYVCELWNTLSSFAMVGAGVVGIWMYRRMLERRFLIAFGLLSLVGVGSVAFHGTLLFGLQMMDELPMLYLVVLMVWVLVENRRERRFGIWFPALLVSYLVTVTLLNTVAKGAVQFAIFHTTFGSLELFSLASVYLLHRRTTDPVVRRVFRLGMAAYVFALTIWFTDLKYCAFITDRLPLPNPQLHAWWHVLVSYGFFCLLSVIAWNRLRVRGETPVMTLRFGVLPIICTAPRVTGDWRVADAPTRSGANHPH